MILLRANQELKQTFERLIVTMKLPVEWNGIFVVVDNYMILQGEVRSLFFHFDTRKVVTNIIELPVMEEEPEAVGNNVNLQNVINMLLYVFGKWGAINGLKVEKDYEQLNRLFSSIMGELQVEPEYNREHFYFYRKGLRITYEDVIQIALESREKPLSDVEAEEGGLWHKLIWTKQQTQFVQVETNAKERLKERIGNNFYMVGYLCPVCGKKLHMVVYPVGREFRIETEEGAVLLARACTCETCRRFYTPRPERMLSEGDVYVMDFEGDKRAYEDYLELMGSRGERVSNCNCNRYADGRRNTDVPVDEISQETLEEICEKLPDYTEEELNKIVKRMEEGFYPDESILRLERKIREWVAQKKAEREEEKENESSQEAVKKSEKVEKKTGEKEKETGIARNAAGSRENAKKKTGDKENGFRQGAAEISENAKKKTGDKENGFRQDAAGISENAKKKTGEKENETEILKDAARKSETVAEMTASRRENGGDGQNRVSQNGKKNRGDGENNSRDEASGNIASSTVINQKESQNGLETADRKETDDGKQHSASQHEKEEKQQKYEAKLAVCERFSERQLKELKSQIMKETDLSPEIKQEYLNQVEKRLTAGKIAQYEKKVESCEGKPYAVVKRVYEEIEQASDIPAKEQTSFLDRLRSLMEQVGNLEVRGLMEKLPVNMDRAKYRAFWEKLHSYEGVDISRFEKQLLDKREEVDRRELSEMVKRARKTDRDDYVELLQRLDESDFLPELVLPYKEKIEAKIRELDEASIDELFADLPNLSFAESMEIYHQIEDGDYLPELKVNALENLSRRLSKVKADECELLEDKLRTSIKAAGIAENERHHFYPAKRVLLGETKPEETEVIDYALASYAAGREPFEYPILVVDASRNGTGGEGIILTPEHLYYSKMFSAYGVSIDAISQITASTGLLNKGLYLHLTDGTKTKLPYEVETKELPAWADVLDEFVRYLQEKPDSRDIQYLAREKHATICCFRCGCIYQGGDTCPQCGYKNNG
jgi:hypothetical protein